MLRTSFICFSLIFAACQPNQQPTQRTNQTGLPSSAAPIEQTQSQGPTATHTPEQPGPSKGWTSGGGGILGDQENPWFLFNTEKVRYCIQIDEQNFSSESLTLAEWGRRIESVIEFWFNEFDFAEHGYFASLHSSYRGSPKVYTNLNWDTFERQERCGGDTDIVFQLGTLDEVQEDYLKQEYGTVIAAAVRTDYDPVNLRGKGFVYVSPERGRLAPGLPGLIPERWSDEKGLFEKVLIHEIGHVFGIKHLDRTIMDYEYVESVVSIDKQFTKMVPPTMSFFSFTGHERIIHCRDQEPRLTFEQWHALGLSKNDLCAQFVISDQDWNLEVYHLDPEDFSIETLRARSDLNFQNDCETIEYRGSSYIVNLTNKQQVFATNRRRLHGPFFIKGIHCNTQKDDLAGRQPDDESGGIHILKLRYLKVKSDQIIFELDPEQSAVTLRIELGIPQSGSPWTR